MAVDTVRPGSEGLSGGAAFFLGSAVAAKFSRSCFMTI